MPPRRGRARGNMRARPPQVIRNSIAELSNYDENVKSAIAQNADAARAHFPVRSNTNSCIPIPPIPADIKLLDFYNQVRHAITNSPVAIQHHSNEPASALQQQVFHFHSFYKTPASSSTPKIQTSSIWHLNECWIIPERLPDELLPPSLRPNLAHRQQPTHHALVPQKSHPNPLLEQLVKEQPDPQNLPDDDDDDEPFGNTAEPQEDDENLDQIADYQTGAHFDDDEGYEEVESGDDAEPVVSF